MLYYEIRATLLTPCCISEQPAMGNEVETLDYIPGTALRGMLAEIYLRRGSKADHLFRRIFCSEEISFPNLYPTNRYPIPLSAHTCKRNPGFTNDDPDTWEELPHGVWDLLFEDFKGCDGFTATCKNRRHQEDCAGPLKSHSMRWYNRAKVSLKSGEMPPQLLITRTAVHLPSGSALEGSLHSQQELAPGTTFVGTLMVSDVTTPNNATNLVDALFKGLCGSADDTIVLTAYTGRRRAGKVEISIQTSEAMPEQDFLSWPKPADYCYFVLTFTSDVILIDRLLRPIITLDRDGKVLKNEMDFPSVDVRVEKAFVHTRRVSGWNAVAQIFKPDDIAMVMGSTFLMRIKESAQQEVKDWMQQRIKHGVGLRRSEGFGQVRFDEPFHRAAAQKRGGPL